jgi:hypothetical protein
VLATTVLGNSSFFKGTGEKAIAEEAGNAAEAGSGTATNTAPLIFFPSLAAQ